MELSALGERVELLRMDTGKANSIGPEFLAALEKALDEVEAGDGAALVLTGVDRFFSAGLDLATLATYDEHQLTEHMRRFEQQVLRLFLIGRPVVGALNGHAIAGGCVVALCCDLRLAARGSWRIGMNELQLGIGIPIGAQVPVQAALGPHAAARVLLEAQLHEPEQALALGLVDELVEPDALLDAAAARAASMAGIPTSVFAQTKRTLREPVLEDARARDPDRLEKWVRIWFEDDTQALIRTTLDRLAKR